MRRLTIKSCPINGTALIRRACQVSCLWAVMVFVFNLQSCSSNANDNTQAPLIAGMEPVKNFELDVSGAMNRVLVVNGRTTKLSFRALVRGKLFLLPHGIEGGCAGGQLQFAFGLYNGGMELAELRYIEPGEVAVIDQGQSIDIWLNFRSYTCNLAEVRFGARFIPDALPTGAAIDRGSSQDRQDDSQGTNPDPVSPDPVDPGEFQHEAPVSIVNLSRPFKGGECTETMLWESKNGCEALTVELDDQVPLMKIRNASKQLSWLMADSAATADRLTKKLLQDRKITVSFGDSEVLTCTADLESKYDTDWVIFQGDPRDRCGLADYLDPESITDLLNVEYQYDNQAFYWRVTVNNELVRSERTKLQIYNRRTRGLMDAIDPISRSETHLTYEVRDDSKLIEILTQQHHLELVFVDSACSGTTVLPYGSYFQNSSIEGIFADKTRPDQSRIPLTPSDLPSPLPNN